MCTAITLQTTEKTTLFGRTMDFSYPITPELYLVPRQYKWMNAMGSQTIANRYQLLGIGQQTEGMLGFFDGVNEHGLAGATLYFAGYAHYDDINAIQSMANRFIQLGSIDFLHYVLGNYQSIDELKQQVKQIRVFGIPDPITHGVAPLHWMLVDRRGQCVVIEPTSQGLIVLDNPLGVLANSPDLPWHLTNLRNYRNVSTIQPDDATWGSFKLPPFGQGGGSFGFPGGFTSPERFVRAAFLKTHINHGNNDIEALLSCFHIMESVSIPKGIVMTNRNTMDYTKYTAFINTKTGAYFFRTYDNFEITTVGMWDDSSTGSQLISLGALKRPVRFARMI